MRGVGSALFVGILLMIAGFLNIIYGIAGLVVLGEPKTA